MDEETFEFAKENDMTLDEAEELQELVDDTSALLLLDLNFSAKSL